MRIAFLFLIGFISLVRAQSPGVRNGHVMVYDSDLQAIVLFGGADESKVCSNTWSYARGKWKKLSEKGPAPEPFRQW